ncbi:hypothetical protein [Chlorobium phaeobacteroides]|uniref:Uncharacterized protein n=1 Tax=Chlorobium phaeobacteroides (strain DSM 266 / SMG 266 / 2430) TaxID=290317 RepID=A1BGV5_CHLPD|nr:hypothetical protein [Chlorobium phaeobacteroides]ABL65632.1 hypothetical protein Cpha266_1611 [Chlorobium phaeobacteroides DSM 266]
MVFSSDSDLLRFQPYVFEHGVVSFEEYHARGVDDIVDELLISWIPAQGTVDVDSFDVERLDALQWVMASVYRVLGWYVLPRLAASVGGQGLLTMMDHYRREYGMEVQRVIRKGVRYDTGSGFERIELVSGSEQQRLRR